MIIRHFNTVNTLDTVESGYSQTCCVSILQWSLGIIFTIMPTDPYKPKPRWGVVKIEQLWAECEDGKWVLCIHTCPRSTHTFENCKAEWQNPQTLNTPHYLRKPRIFIVMQNPSIGLSHTNPTPPTLSIIQQHLPTCTVFSYIYTSHALTSNQFGLAHRLLSPSFIHLCTNLHAQQ